MKAFLVRGTFQMARTWTKFAKEVPAEDEAAAVERVLSDLGSKHRVKRGRIRVNDVREIALEEVGDPVVRFRLGGQG